MDLLQYAIDAIKVYGIELGIKGKNAADKITPEMDGIIDLARQLPVSPAVLWGWYRLHWQGDYESFIDMLVKAQWYAEAEGLDFEIVAKQRMGL